MDAALLIDGVLDPLSQCLDLESARRVSEFEIAPSLQLRVAYLAERGNEGSLTDTERDEYEAYVNVADLISVLKSKAKRRLIQTG